MKTRLGLGIGLTGLVAAAAATGTLSSSLSGQIGFVFCGSGGTTTGCSTATVTMTKVVSGTGTAPSGGWVVTLSSSNCTFPNGSRTSYTLPAAGGSVTSDPLFATTTPSGSTPCQYTVTENAYSGWTTTYNPANGTVTTPLNTTTPNSTVTITNTAVAASPSPSPSPSASASASASSAPKKFPVQSRTGV